MQAGGTECGSKETLNHAEWRKQQWLGWYEQWGKLRELDMAIGETIEKEHCRKYCGLMPQNLEDYEACHIHHDELFRRYLTKIRREDLIEVIRREFRYDKIL